MQPLEGNPRAPPPLRTRLPRRDLNRPVRIAEVGFHGSTWSLHGPSISVKLVMNTDSLSHARERRARCFPAPAARLLSTC